MALAASLDSSDDQRPTVRIRSFGTQFEYTFARAAHAFKPDSVCKEPIKTRSGAKRSAMAVPSARNSTGQLTAGETQRKKSEIEYFGYEKRIKERCESSEQNIPGLERMSKVHPGLELASRMVLIALYFSDRSTPMSLKQNLLSSPARDGRLLDHDLARC
jgi:hypothetical protein